MIQKPNRDEFEKEMKELEAIAQTTLTEVRQNRDKKRQVLDAGRGGDGANYSAEIGGHIDKVKKFRAEKRNLIESLKTMNERLKILDA